MQFFHFEEEALNPHWRGREPTYLSWSHPQVKLELYFCHPLLFMGLLLEITPEVRG